MKTTKKLLALLLAVCMVLGMTACAGSGTPASSTTTDTTSAGETAQKVDTDGKSKTVSIAISENITDLDPHNHNNVVNSMMDDMIYSMLVKADHEGNYNPALATEWSVSEDGTEWTFKLREGVLFSNGEPFNADDVVCTFQRLIDSPELVCAANNWTALKAVEKIDEYTAKITLSESIGTMLLALSMTPIIPDQAYAEMGKDLFYGQKMYGTGKWKFIEWVDGQYLKLAKNENSWEGNDSYFDDVNIRFILESSTAINAQITGDVDAYIASGGIAADMLSMYAGSENKIEIVNVPCSTIDYLQFQCEEGSVFADPDVRRAFSMAIDRQTIIDNIFGGGGYPTGVTSVSTMGYDPDYTCEYYEYNPEKAKALLETTGYAGEELVISSNVATTNAEAMLLAISENVNAIGFNTRIEVVEGATLLDMRSSGNYDMFVVAAMMTSGDFFSFANLRVLNDAHHSNYVNEEMFDQIREANVNPDNTVRDECYRTMNQIMCEECAPMIGLLTLNANEAVTYGITGISLYSDGFYGFENISYDPSLVK